MTNPFNGEIPDSIVETYIQNQLQIKELQDANDRLKRVITELVTPEQNHLFGSNPEHYVTVSSRHTYSNYTNPRVEEIESEIATLKAKLSTLKTVEQGKGNATFVAGSKILTVRKMSKKLKEQIFGPEPVTLEDVIQKEEDDF